MRRCASRLLPRGTKNSRGTIAEALSGYREVAGAIGERGRLVRAVRQGISKEGMIIARLLVHSRGFVELSIAADTLILDSSRVVELGPW